MQLNEKIDQLKDQLIASVQELVKIKSVEGEAKEGMPYGEGPTKALECAIKISEKLGFKTRNVENRVAYAEFGEGEDYVGILGHLDVVPEGDGWIHPPYGAEIHDGKIYGRGTADDKGPIIAALYGLVAIKELNLPLSKRVRIIFGTNEESGSNEIKYYLAKEKPPVLGFTPDADFPIINGEKGLTTFDIVKNFGEVAEGVCNIKYIKGGNKANMVPDYCEAAIITGNMDELMETLEDYKTRRKCNMEAVKSGDMVIIKSYGKSAHGSTPELGLNAIMQLIAFVATLDLAADDKRDLIEYLDENIGMETNGESMNVGLYDEVSGNLSFNVGVIDFNEKKAVITLNLRYPVTKTYEDMIVPLEEKLKEIDLKIENMGHHKPLYYNEDHVLIKKLQQVYTEETGEEAKLISIGGGTYAKEMPNTVAFGPRFPGSPDVIHQPNEYIEIDKLILSAKIYAKAIYELAK
ncbi:dipeptidase PepV [Clostridium cellulovorans]|uniref:Dipeptidase n=1 Tax=Clostridium cellulovorans (strain ATCC 35296 / DSM 3052 / OCM 3 / 743B) TaxID=573061 RepID=D9ST20_CLOC7|nr:dipeptidase PepV [Clostridium cellulovorans]ADL52682.1 dipeptidase [Clostridium cellulovorans 743B]